jgi:hypothetical protein
MIDPPPLIGPAAPLRRVERAPRDGDPGRGKEHGADQGKHDEHDHEPEEEGDGGVHIDVRV